VNPRPANGSARFLLALSFVAFVSLGLPDGILGVAWPSMRATFALPLDALGPLLVSTTAGYVASSFLAGRLLARMTVGTLLALSCGLTAASLFGYAAAATLAPSQAAQPAPSPAQPAGDVEAWAVVIAFGALAGIGAGAIDAGLNTYVAANHGPRTLNLLHAFYGLGATAGPAIMTGVLVAGASWRSGYVVVASAQVLLALAFLATRTRWPSTGATAASAPPAPPLAATLRLPAARLSVVAFFVYVGLEASAGAWLYSLLHEARGIPTATAGSAASLFWGGLLAARLVFGLLVPDAHHSRALPVLATAVIGAAAVLLATGPGVALAATATAILGFACGPVFPSLIATTARRLGADHAANGVGVQIAAAALGQSLVPAAIGVAATGWGLEVLPAALAALAGVLLVVLYLVDRPALTDAIPPAPAPHAPAARRRAPSRRT
jgi:fucose permease